jgi:hypothetical protein
VRVLLLHGKEWKAKPPPLLNKKEQRGEKDRKTERQKDQRNNTNHAKKTKKKKKKKKKRGTHTPSSCAPSPYRPPQPKTESTRCVSQAGRRHRHCHCHLHRHRHRHRHMRVDANAPSRLRLRFRWPRRPWHEQAAHRPAPETWPAPRRLRISGALIPTQNRCLPCMLPRCMSGRTEWRSGPATQPFGRHATPECGLHGHSLPVGRRLGPGRHPGLMPMDPSSRYHVGLFACGAWSHEKQGERYMHPQHQQYIDFQAMFNDHARRA